MALSDPVRAHRAAWHVCLEQPPPPRPRLCRLLRHALLQHHREGGVTHSTQPLGRLGLSMANLLSKVQGPTATKGQSHDSDTGLFLISGSSASSTTVQMSCSHSGPGLQDREGTTPETLQENERWGKGQRQPGSGQRSACTTPFV